ncbi:MAG TPA: hypothetical protein VFQ35_28435 [Polyangiaceae bacterium]|nr:hypothetical protein [Polyangiaceae bacterium]
MKRRDQARFEAELLQTLRCEMEGPPRAAARVQVSKQLEATFAGLDLGLANLASLPHSATPLKAGVTKLGSSAASAKASSAAAVKFGAPMGAAKGFLGGILPALSATAHPVATVLATFALGAAAGTGIMVASEATQAPHKPNVVAVRPPPEKSPPKPPPEAAPPLNAHAPHALLNPTDDARIVGHAVAPVSPRGRDAKADPPRRLAAATPPVASQAAPELGPLAAQQTLLDQARKALSRGDAESALSSLAEHERAFNATLFEEERLSLKIKSLAASGRRDDARAMADAFGARFPRSILLPSVKAAASGEKP